MLQTVELAAAVIYQCAVIRAGTDGILARVTWDAFKLTSQALKQTNCAGLTFRSTGFVGHCAGNALRGNGQRVTKPRKVMMQSVTS